MAFSTRELVRLALCYVILTVSLSKCEIDSASPIITTTPVLEKVLEEESGERTLSSTSPNKAYSTSSSPEETVKTSSSYSSSSSSFKDVADIAAVFNNTNEHEGHQQQANSANIISGTITPNAISPILTLPVRHASQQEVGDSDRQEVAQQKQGQPQQQRFRAVQNQGNGNNEGQPDVSEDTPSSSFGASQSFYSNNNDNAVNTVKFYGKMSAGIGSFFSGKNSGNRAETKPDTIAGQSIDSFGIAPRPLSLSSSRREAAFSFPPFVARKDGFVSSSLRENNESRSGSDETESSIPMHTWIPAGLTFSCKNRVPGYYADASSVSKCQVYHMCMTDGRKYTLLCGIGTVFNQLTFVCDHWYNYQCAEAESDSEINRKLWEEFVGDEANDEEELGDNDQRSGGLDTAIENDSVHQSVPLRSPFTITSKISKTRRGALS